MKRHPRTVLAISAVSGTMLAAMASPADARKHKQDEELAYQAVMPQEFAQPTQPNGAIFQPSDGYAALTSGGAAARVGDIITITLTESTQASKSTSGTTSRTGNIGITPPTTGPFSLFSSSDASASGAQGFAGKGDAAQSNRLTGELTVTVARVLPNGALFVQGQKQLTLNRGDEWIRISGIVRPQDLGLDNRVLSTRVADARITYTGKGEISRAATQGWLQRFFSRISPF